MFTKKLCITIPLTYLVETRNSAVCSVKRDPLENKKKINKIAGLVPVGVFMCCNQYTVLPAWVEQNSVLSTAQKGEIILRC